MSKQKHRWGYSDMLRCTTTEGENMEQMDLLLQRGWKNFFGIKRELLN